MKVCLRINQKPHEELRRDFLETDTAVDEQEEGSTEMITTDGDEAKNSISSIEPQNGTFPDAT